MLRINNNVGLIYSVTTCEQMKTTKGLCTDCAAFYNNYSRQKAMLKAQGWRYIQ